MSNRINVLVFILLASVFSSDLYAQLEQKANLIFLWDVTQSMKGVYQDRSTGEYKTDKSKDIYKEVSNVIVNVINSVEEDAGEIVIIPFQDKVLEEKHFTTTTEGIEQAIAYVQNYNNEDITYTNICDAWEYSLKKINPAEKNLIYLLTDGEQSDLSKRNSQWGTDCIYRVLESYCKLAERAKNTYAFYISLNTELQSDLKNAICQTCPENLRCSEGTPPSQIIDIQPNKQVQVVNIQDGELSFDQSFDIRGNLSPAFRYNAILSLPSDQLPAGYKIKLKQKNDLTINNGKTTFELDLSSAALQQLQQNAPEEITGTIYYQKQDLNQLGIGDNIIEFTPNKVQLKIRNRKEKTLKIKIVE